MQVKDNASEEFDEVSMRRHAKEARLPRQHEALTQMEWAAHGDPRQRRHQVPLTE